MHLYISLRASLSLSKHNRPAGDAPYHADSAGMQAAQSGRESAFLPCAGIGTRSIYSVGRLQAFTKSDESRRYHLGGLKQLERDWVQHQRQIHGKNIIWGWPHRWFRRVTRPAS